MSNKFSLAVLAAYTETTGQHDERETDLCTHVFRKTSTRDVPAAINGARNEMARQIGEFLQLPPSLREAVNTFIHKCGVGP